MPLSRGSLDILDGELWLLKDEGVTIGFVNILDVVGSGAVASISGRTGTLTLTDIHSQSHDHSASADGNSLLPVTLEVPNGAGGTTVSLAGQITVDTTSRTLNFHDGTAEVVLNTEITESFVILNPVATDDYPIKKFKKAITLTQVDYLAEGGTNWIGQLVEMDSDGNNSTDTQAADSTATAGSNTQVVSFSNAGLDAGDYMGIKSTSISGTPTSLTVTYSYRFVA